MTETATETESPTPDQTLTPTATAETEGPIWQTYQFTTFDDGSLGDWYIDEAFTLVPSGSGYALQTQLDAQNVWSGIHFYDVAAQARFLLSDGAAIVYARAGLDGGMYYATLNMDGQVTLYRSGVEVASAMTSGFDANTWVTLRLSAVQSEITVAVDSVDLITYSDPLPLPDGEVGYSVLFTPTPPEEIPPVHVALIDDLLVETPQTIASPTPSATMTETTTATDAPSLTPTPTDEPALSLIAFNDFEHGFPPEWHYGETWFSIPTDQSRVLHIMPPGSFGTLYPDVQGDTVLQGNIWFHNVTAHMTLRYTGTSGYEVVIHSSGDVELYRNRDLVMASSVALSQDTWHGFQFSAIEGNVRLTIDTTEVLHFVDEEPLVAGVIALDADGSEDSWFWLDNLAQYGTPRPGFNSATSSYPSQPGSDIRNFAVAVPASVYGGQLGFINTQYFTYPTSRIERRVIVGNPTDLTRWSLGFASDFDWSSDGAYIATGHPFSRHRMSDGFVTNWNFEDLGGDGTCPSWSPSGESIAFVRWTGNLQPLTSLGLHFTLLPSDDTLAIFPEEIDQYVSKVEPSIEVYLGCALWSPDGTRMAVVATPPSSNPDIFLLSPNGTMTQLTFDAQLERNLRWSPTGDGLTYEAYIDGHTKVFIVDANTPGVSPIQLSPAEFDDSAPTWSPDGQQVAFRRYSINESSGLGIYIQPLYPVINPAFAYSLPGTTANDNRPDWSPDGSSIAVERWQDQSTFIVVMSVASGETAPILQGLGEDRNPRWSPLMQIEITPTPTPTETPTPTATSTPTPTPTPTATPTPWPIDVGITILPDISIPQISDPGLVSDANKCNRSLSSDNPVFDIKSRESCATTTLMSYIDFVEAQGNRLTWNDLIELIVYLEGGNFMLGSVGSEGETILGNPVPMPAEQCFANLDFLANFYNVGEARTDIHVSGSQYCANLQADFTYAVVEQLYSVCASRDYANYAGDCTQDRLIEYLSGIQAWYQDDQVWLGSGQFADRAVVLEAANVYSSLVEDELQQQSTGVQWGQCPCAWGNKESQISAVEGRQRSIEQEELQPDGRTRIIPATFYYANSYFEYADDVPGLNPLWKFFKVW